MKIQFMSIKTLLPSNFAIIYFANLFIIYRFENLKISLSKFLILTLKKNLQPEI